MLLSDSIARLIEEMLDEGDGSADLKRNDLASRLGCVPSQISYVISSRFTPERGYITESRRGGGGYIRIVRVKMDKNKYLMHFFQAIGDSVSEADARAYLMNLRDSGIITSQEQHIVDAAVNGSSLDRVAPSERNAVRADIMRHVIMALIG
jgi:transcriptional regulator CtsR